MNVIVEPGARVELRDAVAWYEGEREGLGVEFLDAFVKTHLSKCWMT